MFCDLNYRQDEGALEGPEKDWEIIFQRIRQRHGYEEKQAICLYTVGRRRRRNIRHICIPYTNNLNISLYCAIYFFQEMPYQIQRHVATLMRKSIPSCEWSANISHCLSKDAIFLSKRALCTSGSHKSPNPISVNRTAPIKAYFKLREQLCVFMGAVISTENLLQLQNGGFGFPRLRHVRRFPRATMARPAWKSSVKWSITREHPVFCRQTWIPARLYRQSDNLCDGMGGKVLLRSQEAIVFLLWLCELNVVDFEFLIHLDMNPMGKICTALQIWTRWIEMVVNPINEHPHL